MASTVSLRLPDELADKLDQISKDTQRTKTFIIKKALKQYIDDFSDYQTALDRLHDKDDEIIDPQGMRKRLGL